MKWTYPLLLLTMLSTVPGLVSCSGWPLQPSSTFRSPWEDSSLPRWINSHCCLLAYRCRNPLKLLLEWWEIAHVQLWYQIVMVLDIGSSPWVIHCVISQRLGFLWAYGCMLVGLVRENPSISSSKGKLHFQFFWKKCLPSFIGTNL